MKPVYTTDQQYRVMQGANGYFHRQQFSGGKGTKTESPWFNRGPKIDSLKDALAWLRGKEPPKATKPGA